MSCLGRRNWPPEWKGPFGPDNPLPRGEEGVLLRLELASSILKDPHCIVVMTWNDREYIASLHFDGEDFLREIVALLQKCLGRPIAEIGSLDIP